jgi:hypothetical protein
MKHFHAGDQVVYDEMLSSYRARTDCRKTEELTFRFSSMVCGAAKERKKKGYGCEVRDHLAWMIESNVQLPVLLFFTRAL